MKVVLRPTEWRKLLIKQVYSDILGYRKDKAADVVSVIRDFDDNVIIEILPEIKEAEDG